LVLAALYGFFLYVAFLYGFLYGTDIYTKEAYL